MYFTTRNEAKSSPPSSPSPIHFVGSKAIKIAFATGALPGAPEPRCLQRSPRQSKLDFRGRFAAGREKEKKRDREEKGGRERWEKIGPDLVRLGNVYCLTRHIFRSFRRQWGGCGISRDCSRSQSPQCVQCWVVCARPLLITVACMCIGPEKAR